MQYIYLIMVCGIIIPGIIWWLVGVKYNRRFLALLGIAILWGQMVYMFTSKPYRWQRLKVSVNAVLHGHSLEEEILSNKK